MENGNKIMWRRAWGKSQHAGQFNRPLSLYGHSMSIITNHSFGFRDAAIFIIVIKYSSSKSVLVVNENNADVSRGSL